MTSPTARAELDRLVADGLDRYRRGDLDGALTAWEAALQAVPGDSRALGYVDYVRQHYDQLIVDAPSPIAELLVPFELGTIGDSDDYEISVSRPHASPMTWKGARLAEPGFDDGWPMESERTGVGVVTAVALDDDYESLTLGQAGRSDPALRVPAAADPGESTASGYQRVALHQRPTVDLSFDFGGRELTGEPTIDRAMMPRPARRTAPMGVTQPIPPARTGTLQTLRGGATRPPAPARPRPAPSPSAALDAFDDLELGLALDLDLPGSPLELGIETLTPGLEPLPAPALPPDQRPVHVEELRLPPPTSTRTRTIDNDDLAPPLPPLSTLGGPSVQLLAEIDRDRPRGESADAAARRRIIRLIERARAEANGGDPAQVIVAIELALAEAPDSAVAQKLIHKNRDGLLDCYYRCFGSLERRPVVTGSLADLKTSGVDPRAAFLLSRIDGMLTFDELLDVAGMGRLEACRHLANLMGRGLVRST